MIFFYKYFKVLILLFLIVYVLSLFDSKKKNIKKYYHDYNNAEIIKTKYKNKKIEFKNYELIKKESLSFAIKKILFQIDEKKKIYYKNNNYSIFITTELPHEANRIFIYSTFFKIDHVTTEYKNRINRTKKLSDRIFYFDLVSGQIPLKLNINEFSKYKNNNLNFIDTFFIADNPCLIFFEKKKILLVDIEDYKMLKKLTNHRCFDNYKINENLSRQYYYVLERMGAEIKEINFLMFFLTIFSFLFVYFTPTKHNNFFAEAILLCVINIIILFYNKSIYLFNHLIFFNFIFLLSYTMIINRFLLFILLVFIISSFLINSGIIYITNILTAMFISIIFYKIIKLY